MRKPAGYWDKYENCYKEAKKYKTRREFEKGCGTAYKGSLRNNWLDKFDWFEEKKKPNGYWNNYENCYEEAKKYKTRTEFLKENRCAHAIALKNGWLDKFTWFEEKQKPKGYWDYDRCYEEAKKYKTIGELRKANGACYNAARKNKWLDEFVWLVDGRVKLFTDKIDCIYYYYFEQTNSIYVGRTIDRKKRDQSHIYRIDNDTVAKYAYENGFPVPEMVIIEDNLTLEQGQKQEEYWRSFYIKHGYNVLNKAKTGGIGTIGLDKWTKEIVFEEAQKYKTKTEFEINCNGAYRKAKRMGWLKKMVWFVSGHINHKKQSKPILQYTKDGKFIAEYPSMMEAQRQTKILSSQICTCCKGKCNTAHGFVFKYAS